MKPFNLSTLSIRAKISLVNGLLALVIGGAMLYLVMEIAASTVIIDNQNRLVDGQKQTVHQQSALIKDQDKELAQLNLANPSISTEAKRNAAMRWDNGAGLMGFSAPFADPISSVNWNFGSCGSAIAAGGKPP